MNKRILSLGLAGVLALSLSAPVGAVYAGDQTPKSNVSHTWAYTPMYSSVSFEQLRYKVKADNLTVQSLDETIKSMEDMNFDGLIDDLEDAIDELEAEQAKQALLAASMKTAEDALKTVSDALAATGQYTGGLDKAIQGYLAAIMAVSSSVSLKGSIEQLESQLEELEEQKADYFKKTLPDTKAQLKDAVNQIILGAESLYLTILTYEQQADGLVDTKAALERTVAEMEYRYQAGQISQMTLTQVKNGYNTLVASMGAMDTALTYMKSSLQNLMGDTPTGNLTLSPLRIPTEGDITSVAYLTDLEKAREASYSLYSARRTVEDAKEEMEDARREEGKNSYQYKMAEHTYQSALYSQQAAEASFDLGFLNLYNQLAPTLASLGTAEADLAFEKQTYEVAQLKHQQGNLSANKLKDAEDTYRAAQRTFATAQQKLFTAWNSYQNAVVLGIVSTGAAGG